MTDYTTELAEVLHILELEPSGRVHVEGDHRRWHERDAAAILAKLPPGWCGHEQKPGRWAFLDAETGEWIEVKPGVVWGVALEADHD